MFEQLSRIPAEPPRRIEVLPGLRLISAIPRSALFFSLALIAFFVLFPLSVMYSDPAMRLGLGPSKTIQGRVLSTAEDSRCSDATAHRVVYGFAPDPEREIRGVATLYQQSPYYSVKEGDSVEVKFLSSDPSVNMLRNGSTNDTPPVIIFLLMPIFILMMLSPMFVPQLREVRRARQLFKNGRLALAKVVFVKRRVTSSWPGWPGNAASEVYVEFESPAGEKREAVAWCQNDWLINQLTPGTQVHIAYPDKMSDRVVLLEAFMR